MKKKAWLRDFHASGFLGLLIYESAKKTGGLFLIDFLIISMLIRYYMFESLFVHLCCKNV